MAFLQGLNERLNQTEDKNYDTIPDGWYTASIKSAELKPTQSGGLMLNVRFDIAGPTHAGAVVFNGYNIKNQNETAEKIAMQDLKALRTSVGLPALNDTDQLIGLSCQVKVGTQPAKDGYDARNTIKGYKPIDGAMPVATAPKPVAVAPTGAQSRPSWAQKPAQTVASEGKVETPPEEQPAIF